MAKKIVAILLMVAVALPMFASSAKSENLKIGYVDILNVFNEYEKTKEYDKMLEAKKEQKEKELLKRKEKIEKMQSKLSLLSEKEQKKEQQKITKEAQEFRNIEREAFLDLKKQRDEKMKEIIEDINKVIRGYAKKEGFDLVVNENAVLYGAKTLDITEKILRLVNQRQKK